MILILQKGVPPSVVAESEKKLTRLSTAPYFHPSRTNLSLAFHLKPARFPLESFVDTLQLHHGAEVDQNQEEEGQEDGHEVPQPETVDVTVPEGRRQRGHVHIEF